MELKLTNQKFEAKINKQSTWSFQYLKAVLFYFIASCNTNQWEILKLFACETFKWIAFFLVILAHHTQLLSLGILAFHSSKVQLLFCQFDVGGNSDKVFLRHNPKPEQARNCICRTWSFLCPGKYWKQTLWYALISTFDTQTWFANFYSNFYSICAYLFGHIFCELFKFQDNCLNVYNKILLDNIYWSPLACFSIHKLLCYYFEDIWANYLRGTAVRD